MLPAHSCVEQKEEPEDPCDEYTERCRWRTENLPTEFTAGETALSSQESWMLYILECSDGTFYTGITKDIGRRLLQHMTVALPVIPG